MRGFDRFASHANVALVDEALNRATREGGELRAQEGVESLVWHRLFDDEDGFGA